MRDLLTGWRILVMPLHCAISPTKTLKKKDEVLFDHLQDYRVERKGGVEEILTARHEEKTSLLIDKTNNNR